MILRCTRLAPRFIENALDELEKDPRQTTLHYQLHGYLTAYWVCIKWPQARRLHKHAEQPGECRSKGEYATGGPYQEVLLLL
ncbi:uncharacterized protein LOC118562683 [Fundulus heteroclitus]|uniref:uncharacterized protein LOC118562683 n=1 Tax=Fundulus heteroclitus TaxID=8078 RepID=UPI00165B9C64|nr:uncharacterized protein LOC118562683 [Fundulus heteroclitus]